MRYAGPNNPSGVFVFAIISYYFVDIQAVWSGFWSKSDKHGIENRTGLAILEIIDYSRYF
jgi:hypothetical protein